MTKNRTATLQPAPRPFLAWLDNFAASGEPARLYARFYGRKDASWEPPEEPLLYVPAHPSRDLGNDLKAAGIERHTAGGKVDFHAIRTTFINHLIAHGIPISDVQALARHAHATTTLESYAREDAQRMVTAVNQLWQTPGVLPVCHEEIRENNSNAQSIDFLDVFDMHGEWRIGDSNP
jgi:hypothetical protein